MRQPIKGRQGYPDISALGQGEGTMTELFDMLRKRRKIRAFSNDKNLVESQRKKIIGSASKAFRQKGVNGVTMEDIARLSRMSVGSIYRYFGSKEDLLFSFWEGFEMRLLEYVISRLPEIRSMAPRQALKELVRAYISTVDASRDQVLILYLDARALPKADQEIIKRGDEILVGLFEEAINRGIKSGDFKTGNAKLCAQNIKVIADSWAVRGWALRETQTVDQYIDHQTEFLMGGLTADVK